MYAHVQPHAFCCYVLGCQQPPIISTRHKRFGLVAACYSHDPHRHGCGLPWQSRATVDLAGHVYIAAGPAPRRDGGTREPVPVRPRTQPPAPAYAPLEF